MDDDLEYEDIDDTIINTPMDDLDDPVMEAIAPLPRRGRRRKDDTTPRETTDYVDKDKFWDNIKTYYDSLGDAYNWTTQKVVDKTKLVKLSDELALMIAEICKKLGNRPNFIGYSYLDELRGDAIHKSLKAIRDGSFKCYTTALVRDVVDNDDGTKTVSYYDKKNIVHKKSLDSTDVFTTEGGDTYITFKQNAFGYFSRIAWHSYLNRIKIENLANDTKNAYMEQKYEEVMQSEAWKNVKRQKYYSEDDTDDVIYEQE